jgi:hypothetical protein
MSVYPEEIQHYQIHLINILEQYMMKVEEAEMVWYDKGDYKPLIADAEAILAKVATLKQIFDEYVTYTQKEKSEEYLKLTRQALSDKKALPRMNYVAYTVFRGEYPVEIQKIRTRLPFIKKIKVVYANGDSAEFTNEKLVKETKK